MAKKQSNNDIGKQKLSIKFNFEFFYGNLFVLVWASILLYSAQEFNFKITLISISFLNYIWIHIVNIFCWIVTRNFDKLLILIKLTSIFWQFFVKLIWMAWKPQYQFNISLFWKFPSLRLAICWPMLKILPIIWISLWSHCAQQVLGL